MRRVRAGELPAISFDLGSTSDQHQAGVLFGSASPEGGSMPATDENATASPGPELIGTPNSAPPVVGGQAGPKPGDRQYEFQAGENAIIGRLAGKMHFVGLFLLAIGLLLIAMGVVMFHSGPIISAGPIISG